MLRFSGGLVLIQHNGLFRTATGAVQPHAGLTGRGTPRLFQHLQGRLIRVQHRLLAKPFMPLCDAYDYIIIDCGLKQELLTVNALSASDYCIIPVQSHFLASEGIPDVLDMVRSVQKHFNPDLKIAGILLTMYQSRPQLCKSVQQSVREIYGDDLHVFERPIEYTIRIAECPMAGMSILDYEPGNPAAESYRNLASEVLRLG